MPACLLQSDSRYLWHIKDARAGWFNLACMERYRVHFLKHSGHIFGTEDFEAQPDQHAIDYAREMFATSIGKGHELWHEDRHVHTEIYR